eukprot:scaffold232629_cov17-Tisochrysis_lutea.AAC.1
MDVGMKPPGAKKTALGFCAFLEQHTFIFTVVKLGHLPACGHAHMLATSYLFSFILDWRLLHRYGACMLVEHLMNMT